MKNYPKLKAIKELSETGMGHTELEADLLALIVKVASTPPDSPLKVQAPQVERNGIYGQNGERYVSHDSAQQIQAERRAWRIGIPVVTIDELNLAYRNKIEAIKLYRNRTGATIRESKEAIDKAMEKIRVAINGCQYSTPYYVEPDDMPF